MPAPKGNQYAIGNKGGRPPIFKSPKELAKKVDKYFVFIKGESHIEKKKVLNQDSKKFQIIEVTVWDREPEPATITGLVLYLGFNSRSSLDDYEEMEEYSYIIKRARTRVAFEYEKRLSGDQRPTGAIFALKNMGWMDNNSIKLTGDPEKPVGIQTNSNIDYTKLSDEVLEAIAKARKPSNE
jgi:hypothetical protein